MQLAMENEEGDAKFLDTNGFRDIGSTDDFNTEITEMDAENDVCQTFDAIDDKAGLQEDTLHTEGLNVEEPIAEMWNQLDNEMDLDQDTITTENNACDEETKVSDTGEGRQTYSFAGHANLHGLQTRYGCMTRFLERLKRQSYRKERKSQILRKGTHQDLLMESLDLNAIVENRFLTSVLFTLIRKRTTPSLNHHLVARIVERNFRANQN
jgi:hypothetical protein